MRVIVQRVKKASVKVEGNIVASIKQGYLLLVGFTHEDNSFIVKKVAEKITNLRIFSDENDKMNLAIKEVKGEILSVSQFTLYGDVSGGRRPSFTSSAKADKAKELYELFNEYLDKLEINTKSGIFQSYMEVESINDGPVTVIIDSEDLK